MKSSDVSYAITVTDQSYIKDLTTGWKLSDTIEPHNTKFYSFYIQSSLKKTDAKLTLEVVHQHCFIMQTD